MKQYLFQNNVLDSMCKPKKVKSFTKSDGTLTGIASRPISIPNDYHSVATHGCGIPAQIDRSLTLQLHPTYEIS